MAKTANINVRIDPETKAGAEKLFVKQPRYSAETEAAIQEARDIMNGNICTKSYSSARELFAELDAEMDGE